MADAWKEPESGDLKHRVTWNKRVIADATAVSCGQEVTTFPPQGTFWASLEPFEGRLDFNADQIKRLRFFRIKMRASPSRSIAAQDQLAFQGRILTVRAVNTPGENSFWLDIVACEQY